MKYYLITGASSGIGYTTCQLLLSKGHFVFGSVRKEADAQRLSNDFGDQFQALIFDVCDEEAIQQAVLAVEKTVGENGLAGLVNNAGVVVYGPLKELEVSEFERQININVFGLLRVTKAFLPLLGAQRPQKFSPGKIINISSVSAIFTTPFLAPYCASKKSVEAITDGLRMELLPYGIDVVSILPGPVKTPIWAKADTQKNNFAGTDYEKIMARSARMIAKAEEKAIEPEEVAQLIAGIFANRKKRPHYIITANPWPMRIARRLPARWVDYFIKKTMKFE